MSPDQKRQMEEARARAMHDECYVDATGRKVRGEMHSNAEHDYKSDKINME